MPSSPPPRPDARPVRVRRLVVVMVLGESVSFIAVVAGDLPGARDALSVDTAVGVVGTTRLLIASR